MAYCCALEALCEEFDDGLDGVGPDVDYLVVVDCFLIVDDLDYVKEVLDCAFGRNNDLGRNRRSDRIGSSHPLVDSGHP